jgi:peptide/nickel transport system permease protein
MRSFASRFARQRAGVAAALFVALLVGISIAVPLVGVGDADRITNDVLIGPSQLHPLGTDDLGREVAVDLLRGVPVSLIVGFAAAAAASSLGIVIGAASGHYGGIADLAVMRLAEIFQVIPSFILAAVLVALSGPGLLRVVAVIALLAWPQVARVMRGEVLRVKHLDFVDAVRCLGFREGYVLFAEVIPNAIAPVLAVGTMIVGQAILLEASLAFFGLSDVDIVSWGRMLNSGQRFLFNAWWLSFFPGVAIFCTVLAFNLLGDAIGATLDPKGTR